MNRNNSSCKQLVLASALSVLTLTAAAQNDSNIYLYEIWVVQSYGLDWWGVCGVFVFFPHFFDGFGLIFRHPLAYLRFDNLRGDVACFCFAVCLNHFVVCRNRFVVRFFRFVVCR